MHFPSLLYAHGELCCVLFDVKDTQNYWPWALQVVIWQILGWAFVFGEPGLHTINSVLQFRAGIWVTFTVKKKRRKWSVSTQLKADSTWAVSLAVGVKNGFIAQIQQHWDMHSISRGINASTPFFALVSSHTRVLAGTGHPIWADSAFFSSLMKSWASSWFFYIYYSPESF